MTIRSLVSLMLLMAAEVSFAYEVETHKDLTRQAVQASNLAARLPDFGLSFGLGGEAAQNELSSKHAAP